MFYRFNKTCKIPIALKPLKNMSESTKIYKKFWDKIIEMLK